MEESVKYSVPSLRRGYSAIVRGYHVFDYNDTKVYLKHLSPLEQSDLDEEYDRWFESARGRGLATNEEREAILKREGFWTDAEEAAITKILDETELLRRDKQTALLPSQAREISSKLKESERKLQEALWNKRSIVGITAELFAQQKADEFYVLSSLFKNPEFTQRLFTEDEAEELERTDVERLAILYGKSLENVDTDCIKRIALQQFFQEPFRLCKENAQSFFGKPIAFLTFFQTRLVNFGSYFKSVLSCEQQIPSHLLNDPDGLIDWVTGARNSKAIRVDKEDAHSVALVGGTISDMKELGLTKNAKSIHEISKGKPMTMAEMMRAQGFS